MPTAKKNKVKFNVKNAHYALITEGEGGEFTYGTPVAIPGTVAISLEPSGEITPFYADGIVYYQSASNTGYEGDAEFAMIPDQFRIDVLGDTKDSKGVLIENSDVETKKFAFLFEFDGDQKEIRRCFYNCVATRPTVESETSESTKEPGTETITITASPHPTKKQVLAKTGDDTDETTYDNWYKAVYVTEDTEETNG